MFLRTRKINKNGYNQNTFWKYFCSQGCMHDFMNSNADQVVAIAPRPTPLETPIEVSKEEREGWNGRTYIETQITERT